MKKSQRLRLASLLEKKNSGALSADEAAELSRLEALAAQHPDSSKDEDDTKISAAGFMEKLTAAFRDKSDLAAKNKAQGALLDCVAVFLGVKADELAAKTPEQLTAALAAKAGAVSQADANNETVKAANLAKANAESAKTAAESLAQIYVAGLSAVKITAVAADAAKGITVADVTTAINARVQVLAGEKLSELGFPAGGIPSSSSNADEPTGFTAKMEHYNQLKGPEREAYYARVIAPELAKDPSRN